MMEPNPEQRVPVIERVHPPESFPIRPPVFAPVC